MSKRFGRGAAKKDEPKEEKKAEPAPAPAEEPKAAEPPKPRGNVLQMFPQAQIQEYKEAFTMMDANRDGFIGADDLTSMFQNLGKEPDKKEVDSMLKEVPGQLNFTAFLTLFGEKLHGSDSETALRSAFEMFDENEKGEIPEAYLKELLTSVGDIFNDGELRQMMKDAPISGGVFDYNKYVTLIKRGPQDE